MANWSTEPIKSSFSMIGGPPKPPPDTVLVYRYKQVWEPVGPGGLEINGLDWVRGQYEFWFVPTAPQPLLIDFSLRSRQKGVDFPVNIEMNYEIDDPVVALRQMLRDQKGGAQISAVLEKLVEDELRARYLEQFEPAESAKLETEIRRFLTTRGDVAKEGFRLRLLRLRIGDHVIVERTGREVFTVQQDALVSAVKHTNALTSADRAIELEEKKGKLDALRADNEIAVLDRKAKYYHGLLSKGMYQELALAMAGNESRDTITALLQQFQDSRTRDEERHWKIFTELLSARDIDPRIDEVKRAYRAVKELSAEGASKRLTEGEAQSQDDELDDLDLSDLLDNERSGEQP